MSSNTRADGFRLDGLVWAPVADAAIALDDHRQVIVLDLRFGQRQPLPQQGAANLPFKNALRVGLDQAAR